MDCHPIHHTIDLVGFFTLGLLGSFGHCIAMCSPFVLFVSRRHAGNDSRVAALVAQGWYTAGRVFTYALLGALAGALGGAVQAAGRFVGVQRAALLVAGGVLVAWAVVALADAAGSIRPLRLRREPASRLFGRIAAMTKGCVPGHPFATGLMLGLLPCGLLYSAVVGAVGRGGALGGAAALILFGLGTAPALLGVSIADELLARNRGPLNRLSQAFILAMGAWFLWRGLGQ